MTPIIALSGKRNSRRLGGIDRDAYRTMFSLDDETLEKVAKAF
ncbi:uncharacterized protein YhaN [Bradyrhizobium yuanmingense]